MTDRVVVSFTTIPSRVNLLPHTLRSLARQTRRPDAVYLCLPKWSAREGRAYVIPDIAEFPFVQIIADCADDGPATKLLPALVAEADPTTRVVTVDDDVEYASDWLDRLLSGSARFPGAAVGFCGFNVGPLLRGADVYDLLYEELSEIPDGICADVLEGWRGICYQRGHFGEVSDMRTFLRRLPSEARLADDVWISGYLASRKIERRVVCYRDARLCQNDIEVIWNNRGVASSANGLIYVGNSIGRNKRVAKAVFKKE